MRKELHGFLRQNGCEGHARDAPGCQGLDVAERVRSLRLESSCGENPVPVRARSRAVCCVSEGGEAADRGLPTC